MARAAHEACAACATRSAVHAAVAPMRQCYCAIGNTIRQGDPTRVRPPARIHSRPDHRRGRPRPLDRLARRPQRRQPARRRQDRRRRRRLGDRLRDRAQQLLPAGDAGADGRLRRGLGVRARAAALPPLRLHRARARRAGRRSHRGLRAPAADRLSVAAVRRHRRGDRAHEVALPRLARPGPQRLPARVRRRLRLQPGVDARPRAAGDRGRRPDRARASRSPASSSTTPARSRSCTPTRATSHAEQVVVAVGPWVASLWSMLGLPDRLDVRQPDGELVNDQAMWTYWYLQEGEAAFDPKSFVTDDGVSSPVLHVDSDGAAVRRRRHARHRRVLGRLLQARPRLDPGRRPAADGRPGVQGRPVPDRHRRPRLPRPVVGVAEPLPEPASRAPAPSTARSAPAASARSRSTTSRCSTGCARTCSSPPTPTTATR